MSYERRFKVGDLVHVTRDFVQASGFMIEDVLKIINYNGNTSYYLKVHIPCSKTSTTIGWYVDDMYLGDVCDYNDIEYHTATLR